MIPYLIILAIVIVMALIAEKLKASNHNKLVRWLVCAIILALSTFAGVRSVDLGWDARKYVVGTFWRLEQYNDSFSRYMSSTFVEPGFSALSWLLYKLTPNINFLLFGYSLITNVAIYKFLLKEKSSLVFGSFIYFSTLYLMSFNIIRQAISIPLTLLSFSYLKDNKMTISIILLILASSFHMSSLFSVVIWLIYYLVKKSKRPRNSTIAIIAVVTGLAIFYQSLALLLNRIGILSEKYYSYILSYDVADSNLTNIALSSFWVITALATCPTRRKAKLFYVVNLIIALIINIASIKVHPIYRLGLYFLFFGVFYASKNLEGSKNDNSKIIKTTTVVVMSLWIFWTILWGNSYNIYPYSLGIK